MAGKSFSGQVNAFVQKTKARQVAVFREAVQRTIAAAQTPVSDGGNMPTRTGFLRSSGVATRDGSMPPLKETPKEGAFVYAGEETTLVIAGAGLDDKILFAWTARYAMRVNAGFVGTDSLGREYHQAGRRFMDLAAQRWPQIVSAAAAELQGRVQGREAAAIYQAGG